MGLNKSRGAGSKPGYSGKLVLKYAGELTAEDRKEIYKETGCRAIILEDKAGRRCLGVRAATKGDDSQMDEAITLAISKIRESAEEKIRMDPNGRPIRGRQRANPPPPPQQMPMMAQMAMMPPPQMPQMAMMPPHQMPQMPMMPFGMPMVQMPMMAPPQMPQMSMMPPQQMPQMPEMQQKGTKNLLAKQYQAGVPSAAASSAGPSFPDSPAGEDVDFEDCQDEGDCAGSDEIDFDTYFEEPPEEPPAQTPEPAHKKPRHHKFMTPRPKKHPGASTMRQSQKTHVYVEDSDDEKRDDPPVRGSAARAVNNDDDWPENAHGADPLPQADRLPQTLPRVNFYSFGWYTQSTFEPGDKGALASYLEARYGIQQAFIYDVRNFCLLRGVTPHPKHWGESYSMLEALEQSSMFTNLLQSVRPALEARLDQREMVINVVFVCNQGRHRSVACAKMLRGILGTHPGLA